MYMEKNKKVVFEIQITKKIIELLLPNKRVHNFVYLRLVQTQLRKSKSGISLVIISC